MKKMNDLVNRMIQEHQGGEEFFNNLDENLKNDLFVEQLWRMATKKYFSDEFIAISSGRFGLYFSSFLSTLWYRTFNICVNGGLRKGAKIISLEPWADKINGSDIIFFDDSFYLGRTRDSIKREVEKWGGDLIETYVCYDGSLYKDETVTSIYRYYKE